MKPKLIENDACPFCGDRHILHGKLKDPDPGVLNFNKARCGRQAPELIFRQRPVMSFETEDWVKLIGFGSEFGFKSYYKCKTLADDEVSIGIGA